MTDYHISVLKNEVIEYLAVTPGRKYIDATLGGGGHTEVIVREGGIVLGIDQDQDALTYVSERFSDQKIGKEIYLARGNFRNIDTIAIEHGFEQVSGILFDLGVSSYQLDTAERGFSFQKPGPLDMRMDQTLSVTAKDLINGLTKQELSELFYKLGEEYQSRRIAHAIVSEREKRAIETTQDLEKIIRHTLGGRASGETKHAIHPATKVFQALRIAINDELHSIEEALPKALTLLMTNGRIAVISFHSLEDRIVKQTFKTWEEKGLGKMLTKKPITATDEDKERNTRARSAKLRVFEKTL